ncbi:gag pol polyprotein [Trichuris trichiura]|uniref:Gag pol polyprotein n=1 Tax=Trichuris trichiura TaxID=36087 RepID=A0A077ZII1_TRITR|nr:gag pol polyprotein [Trichuris trichiura]
MAHSKADLRSILSTQQQTLQQFAQLQEQFAETLQRLSLSQASTEEMVRSHPTLDTLAASISEFDYDPGTEDTFETWFSRYEDFFNIEAAELDDAARVRLLLRKLRTNVPKKDAGYILLRHPRDVRFDETVNILTQMFGQQRSLFNARYRCLNLTKNAHDDYITYGGIVNRECQRFQLGTLSEDNFKCLIFVCGLQSLNDAAVRLKLLNKIKTEPNVMIAKLVGECNHLRNLKRHISVNIEKKAVTFQIDTGSDLTIISVQIWKQLGSPPLSDTSSVRATTYNGDTIPLRGSFRCAYSFGTHSVSGTCYVSDIS